MIKNKGKEIGLVKTREFYSRIGRKGAEVFWNKFYNDPEFREKMRISWKGHRVNYEKIVEAAKLGNKAFWQRYTTDKEFKRTVDKKLAESRAKGGSISLKILGEDGFKKRLERMKNELVKYKYRDKFGNKFRSSLELKVANFLLSKGINYKVEPILECDYHAYYPDFLILGKKPKIVEVMGIGTEKYWKNAERKIKLLLKNYPELRIAVITSFSKMAKKYLSGMSRVNILRWSELDKLALWCREVMPG